jgi:hypothetical protein
MSSTPEATRVALSAKWTDQAISFENIENFPEYYGLYFVILRNEVVYVGKADKQTIAKRCKQYVGRSSGGTLRKKIESVMLCKPQDAINFIKANMQAKFIEIVDIQRIPVIEEIAIWAFQSRLNAIKPGAFQYISLSLI